MNFCIWNLLEKLIDVVQWRVLIDLTVDERDLLRVALDDAEQLVGHVVDQLAFLRSHSKRVVNEPVRCSALHDVLTKSERQARKSERAFASSLRSRVSLRTCGVIGDA